MGDIHGCPDQLEEVLDLGRAFPGHTWVFLGDYLNRGPDHERVIQRLRRLEGVFLRGNHEDRFLAQWAAAEDGAAQGRWLDAMGLSVESVEWIRTTRRSWEAGGCLFVHSDAAELRARLWVVHGHRRVDSPTLVGNRINVNTGCGDGGPLTAVALPELVFVQSKRSPAPRETAAEVFPLAEDDPEELHGP